MSQDEPNSQSPLSSEPGAEQPETTSQQPTGNLQKTSNSFQAVLRVQSIKALRWTIQALEGVVVKLEAEPLAKETPSSFDKLQQGWSAALAKIRSLLPENLSTKLSDPALTGIIAAVIAIAVWTTSLLTGNPPEVAEVPPSEQIPAAKIATPPELTAPAAPEPTELPAAKIATPPELAAPAEPELTELPAPEIATPPELTAPAAPEPIEIAPPPTPELTPEQNLIASIQNQVAEISDRFAERLIQAIQVNFQTSRLTIKVGDDWYNLPESEQDKLAARMLDRSRELDFSHLEITDLQGTMLARSPVVGTDMVILKRKILSNQQQEALSG